MYLTGGGQPRIVLSDLENGFWRMFGVRARVCVCARVFMCLYTESKRRGVPFLTFFVTDVILLPGKFIVKFIYASFC